MGIGTDTNEASCGRLIHRLPCGMNCWQALGSVGDSWSLLGREICAVVETLPGSEKPTCSIHLVILGESRETASAKVLFCSKESRIRTAVKGAFKQSDRTSHCSSIGLHCSSETPEPLAQDDFVWDGQGDSSSAKMEKGEVWAPKVRQEVGRRLYIPVSGGGPPRVATGGPILFAGSKAYQTTVGHVLHDSPKLPLINSHFFSLADLDLESSDFEDDNDTTSYIAQSTSHELVGASVRTEFAHSLENRDENAFSTAAMVPSKDTWPMSLGDIVRVGKFVPRGVTQEQGLDYALVELENFEGEDRNLVSYGQPGSNRMVRVTKPGAINNISSDAPVIVATASGGALAGKLSPSPTWIKPKGQSRCQDMYSVILEAGHSFQPGDCGSTVIGRTTGELFGHIGFGHQGTQIAYILPMNAILESVARTLNLTVSLVPPKQLCQTMSSPRRTTPSGQGAGPHKFTEFGSPEFYENLDGRKMPKRNVLRVAREAVQVGTNIKLPQLHLDLPKKKTKTTFEVLFFNLPPEIRDQIIRLLPFRSAMNLRQVSTKWRAAVSSNASAISKLFLVRNPLPSLAQTLYPNLNQDMQYIQEVGHRHGVASRLAAHIAKWLSQEFYLHKSREQQHHFQSTKRHIQQRLVPSLFAAFHFFEMYPKHLLQHNRSHERHDSLLRRHDVAEFQFERASMEFYSNDILLQTHEIFDIIINFVRRLLSPPSYYGFWERSLRGYLKKAPRDQVYAAILCLGGLDVVVQLANISDVMQRRSAVDRFYASLPRTKKSTPAVQSTFRAEVSRLFHHKAKPAAGSDKTGSIVPMRGLGEDDLRLLLPLLPALNDSWHHTAEALLLEKMVVGSRGDIKNYTQMLTELIRPETTLADILYDGHRLWHALSRYEFGDADDA